MGVLGDLLSGRIRTEMKQRVDEVLKCGNEWGQTAQKLTEALNRLTETVQKGNIDPANLKVVTSGARKLAKETQRLTKAFETLDKTLGNVVTRYG